MVTRPAGFERNFIVMDYDRSDRFVCQMKCLCILLLFIVPAWGQISIVPTNDTGNLQAALTDQDGLTITGFSYSGASSAAGTFSNGPLGIADGVVLSTGEAIGALPPDDFDGISTVHNTPGSPACDSILGAGFTSFDAATLTINFDAGPATNAIALDFIFGSDEYPEFSGLAVTDIFGVFLNGQEIAVDDTTPFITINGRFFANANIALPPENGLEYDGASQLLQAQAPVAPGSANLLEIVICDGGDPQVDSGVLLARLRGLQSALAVVATDEAPQINCPAPLSVAFNTPINLDVTAAGPRLASVTLSSGQLPAGASFDPVLPLSGSDLATALNWTPLASQIGQTAIRLFATTDAGIVDECSIDLTITGDPMPIKDRTRPKCKIVRFDPGPPRTMVVGFLDEQSGIASLEVLKSENAVVTLPHFAPGTNDTLFATAVKNDPAAVAEVIIKVTDMFGNSKLCDPVYATLSNVAPDAFRLIQNYPNPFNPSTSIHFKIAPTISGNTDVSIKIYDITGRLVRTLLNEAVPPGTHVIEWDGRDAGGASVAAGVYLYRMVAGDYAETKKMMLTK